jgi:hypothetical protein
MYLHTNPHSQETTATYVHMSRLCAAIENATAVSSWYVRTYIHTNPHSQEATATYERMSRLCATIENATAVSSWYVRT